MHLPHYHLLASFAVMPVLVLTAPTALYNAYSSNIQASNPAPSAETSSNPHLVARDARPTIIEAPKVVGSHGNTASSANNPASHELAEQPRLVDKNQNNDRKPPTDTHSVKAGEQPYVTSEELTRIKDDIAFLKKTPGQMGEAVKLETDLWWEGVTLGLRANARERVTQWVTNHDTKVKAIKDEVGTEGSLSKAAAGPASEQQIAAAKALELRTIAELKKAHPEIDTKLTEAETLMKSAYEKIEAGFSLGRKPDGVARTQEGQQGIIDAAAKLSSALHSRTLS